MTRVNFLDVVKVDIRMACTSFSDTLNIGSHAKIDVDSEVDVDIENFDVDANWFDADSANVKTPERKLNLW